MLLTQQLVHIDKLRDEVKRLELDKQEIIGAAATDRLNTDVERMVLVAARKYGLFFHQRAETGFGVPDA